MAEPDAGPLPSAEQLLRDMEAARSAVEQPPQAPVPSAAEELARELESLRQATAPQAPGGAPSITPEATAPQAAPADQVPPEPPLVIEAVPAPPDVMPAAAAPPIGNPPAATYSGRLNLMFPSTLTQDEMGLVWEVLEEVSKGGQILDSRLVSASEGIQFTIQLGPMGIMIEDMVAKLFGAQVSELEADRLKVAWPQPR